MYYKINTDIKYYIYLSIFFILLSYLSIFDVLFFILISDGIDLFSFPMLFSLILIFLIYDFPSALLLFWLCFYFFKVLFEYLKNYFE